MEFTRSRGTAASAADFFSSGRRFPDPPPPPPHGESMQGDALLSQLQKDRLCHETILPKLASIERAMGLRSAAADAERASSATFDFDDDQFMTHGGTSTVGPERDDECKKRQEPNQAKKSPSMKWTCPICQVKATSAENLLQHFLGQKHYDKVHALRAEAKEEKSRKATQCEEQPCPQWTCMFCQANCARKSDLEKHLKGKKHHAKVQTLLEECNSMARDSASSSEVNSHPSITSQDEEKPASASVCRICQVKWSCQSVMEGHVGGKKHRKNIQALQQEAKRLGIIQPKMARNEQAPPDWDCSACQVRCNSESQYQDHRRSIGHMLMEKELNFCKLCNLQCNSGKMLAHHQAGKKHRQAKLRSS